MVSFPNVFCSLSPQTSEKNRGGNTKIGNPEKNVSDTTFWILKLY